MLLTDLCGFNSIFCLFSKQSVNQEAFKVTSKVQLKQYKTFKIALNTIIK